MSNNLAIATVTAALRQVLQAAVDADVDGADVTTVRPGQPGAGLPELGVNLYLYRVVPNGAWRNADLPPGGGGRHRQPQVALDLHYLLSFHGAEHRLEPQRLLGCVVHALHKWPVLARDAIAALVRAADDPDDPLYDQVAHLAGSDLATQVELVRFTQLPFGLDELAQLWSTLRAPSALSVVYQGSVVLLGGDPVPAAAEPFTPTTTAPASTGTAAP